MRLLRKLRNWFTEPGTRRWRGVALVVPFVIFMAVSISYTNYVQQRGDERWCELIVLIDESAQVDPPTTPEEILFAEIIGKLRRDFHC